MQRRTSAMYWLIISTGLVLACAGGYGSRDDVARNLDRDKGGTGRQSSR